MRIDTFLRAARVPPTMPLGDFGPWSITRRRVSNPLYSLVGFAEQTILSRHTLATLHTDIGEIVMEDSMPELLRHVPIWRAASGRVLVTGLGLGCVLRGLLAKPTVTHVTVVEKDAHILAAIGGEFADDPRCTLVHADAQEWLPASHFDYAWHDIWSDEPGGEPHLQVLHARLMARYRDYAGRQGAWQFPRELKHLLARRGVSLLGGYRSLHCRSEPSP